MASPRSARFLQTLEHLQQVDAEPISNYIYDPSRAPPHTYAKQLAQRMATVMEGLTKLSALVERRAVTPRVALTQLMRLVRSAISSSLACGPVAVDVSVADRNAAIFDELLSSRSVSPEEMLESLYVLSYVSVKLRVELILTQLRRQLDEELALPRAEKTACAALLVTDTLLRDVVESFNRILSLFPLAQGELAVLLPCVATYFYQLGDVVLLVTNGTALPPISLTTVRHLAIQEEAGLLSFELHRSSPEVPWGMLFNARGQLVGIDVAMRLRPEAKELHRLLNMSRSGATIHSINGKSLRPPSSSSSSSSFETDTAWLAQEMQRVGSTSATTLRLSAHSPAWTTEWQRYPLQLSFAVPFQGGEAASGQRAYLRMHRRQTEAVKWSFALDSELRWSPPQACSMSEEAEIYMRAYGDRLKLLAVNGIEVRSPAQGVALAMQAETVLLELVVLPPSHGVVGATTTAAIPHTTVQEEENVDVEMMMAVRSTSRSATLRSLTAEEVEVIKEPAVLPEKKMAAPTTTTTMADTHVEMEEAEEQKVMDVVPATTDEQVEEAPAVDEDGVAKDAAPVPCLFQHDVRLTAITNDDMKFERPSTNFSWGLQLSVDPHSAHPVLQALPPSVDGSPSSATTHPFARLFYAQRNRPWRIAKVDGRSFTTFKEMAAYLAKRKRMTLMFARV